MILGLITNSNFTMKKVQETVEKSKVIGYLRVSTEKQELANQRNTILEYCHKNQIICNEFVEIEISSRKSEKQRRILELNEKLNANDTLIVTELSRLGRDMLSLLSLINELTKRNIKIIFIKQPELSTNQAHSKLLLSIYSYFAETEREMISWRVKNSLQRIKSEGRKLGRVEGTRNKHNELSQYRILIEKHMKIGLSVSNILKLINQERSDNNEPKLSYTQINYYLKQFPINNI